LNNDELRALIVEKAPWLQNNVTGTKYQMTYSASGPLSTGEALTPIDPGYVTAQLAANQGQLQVDHVGRESLQPSQAGDLAARSYLGATVPYYINDGKIVTVMVGTPIVIAVYKLGDKYIAARSNEFGYANYEVIPDVAELNPLGPGKLELR
jgi:hypothetical protein